MNYSLETNGFLYSFVCRVQVGAQGSPPLLLSDLYSSLSTLPWYGMGKSCFSRETARLLCKTGKGLL